MPANTLHKALWDSVWAEEEEALLPLLVAEREAYRAADLLAWSKLLNTHPVSFEEFMSHGKEENGAEYLAVNNA